MSATRAASLALSEDPKAVAEAPGLSVETQSRLEEIRLRLLALPGEFASNLVGAQADWNRHVLEESALEGMTERGKLRARRSAQAQGLAGFLLTLDGPSYTAAVDHLDDRKLRHDLYEAYVTRASDHGPRAGRFDNTPLVAETLALRHESAQLLGFDNYAELALQTSLLQDPDAVERYLLRTGGEAAKARAQSELDAVWAFAKAKGVPKGFSTWDLGYYAKWWRREQLSFSEDELSAYFPLSAVLAGVFALCERWLGVSAVWLPDDADSGSELSVYQLTDAQGATLARLELSLFRPEGRPEGMRVELDTGGPQTVLRVTCDLSALRDDAPTLLTYTELCGLFRCLGRGLFLLLSGARADDTPALRHSSTIASEVAGYSFERFGAHFETLQTFARHFQSGAPLPRELFERLQQDRELQAGFAATQELELALFDLRVHRDYVPTGKATQLRAHVLDTLSQVRREVCVLRPPFWERMANSSCALFIEGRAARVWENLWAKRMAAELFALLESSGFSPATERELRDSFWAAGPCDVRERLARALGRPVGFEP